jgi:hypothetical protein
VKHSCRRRLPSRLAYTQGLSGAGAKRQNGQALVFSLFAAMLIIVSLYAMYSISGQAIEKIKLQNTADAAAYSAAVAEARDYNFSAYTNRAMVANQVAVAQFVGMTSWFRNMSAFGAPSASNDGTSNAGRTVYQLFFDVFPSPLGNIYMKFLKGLGKITGIFDEGRGGSTFMSAAVTVLDGLIMAYGETQRVYHYGTALTIAETLGAFGTIGQAMADLTGANWFTGMSMLDGGGNVIKANDDNASLTKTIGLTYLVYHLYTWYNFTERKDPNTSGADGTNADRFAQVTMDSLDDFSRDRSTKPAWGFTMFYAPPLTYIDPTRFIPYQNGPLFMPVIHRGGTELKLTNDAGTGGSTGGNPDGSTGVDCHGNSTSPNTSSNGSGTGGISVLHESDLSAYNATACPGDSASVTDNNDPGKEPPGPNAGVYSFDGTKWTKVSSYTSNAGGTNPQNPQGKPGQSTTSTSSTAGRGAAGSMNKKTWTAIDASSWAGLDIFWFTIPIFPIPIPLPIPFAPPWMPLSHGAAQSGKMLSAPTVLSTDNNFGVDSGDAYGGTMSSWTTKLSAEMRQNKGAGKSLDKVSSWGGLTKYMDVKDVTKDNLTGPPLVVEIEKSTDKMAKSPGSGQFAMDNGAPKEKMRALSKSQVFFARPTSDAALEWFKRVSDSPTQVEVGSLYNPYWQARLAPNNFTEQYLSMEVQRIGW